MELEGAKKCLQYLLDRGIPVPEFTSDRHVGIAKWLREQHPEIAHYFDIWHLARSITKKIVKVSKDKDCGKLKEWLQAIRNHLYWCAASSRQGFKELIIAKLESLIRHIANKHENHGSDLFPRCAHEELEPRLWIKVGKMIQECDLFGCSAA